MKVLNLYAGIGGNRKLWKDVDVTAVEINPEIAAIYKDFFPKDKMIIGDAHEYLLENFSKFDFIWSSPPCPSHSRTNTFLHAQGVVRYPDMTLWQEIIFLNYNFTGKWVVENVKPYYKPFNEVEPQSAGRHFFWANFHIINLKLRTPKALTDMTKKELGDWLGMYYEKNVYHRGNHCERQIYRNAIHPKLGKHIFDCAYKEKQEVLI